MASNTELLVELGVDSSKFSKQITAVTKEVKELDKELASHNEYIDCLQKKIEREEEDLKNTENEENETGTENIPDSDLEVKEEDIEV